jgi:peptidoglycan biosynthesis protein MviN/MurJ (putative lipid II flippase)
MEKSRIAGILSIVSGGMGIIGSLIWVVGIIIMSFTIRTAGGFGAPYYPPQQEMAIRMFSIMMIIYAVFAICLFLVSVLAIVGGIYTMKRKYWGLSLAGSIASIIAFFPCGIASLIFVIMGKEEFQSIETEAVSQDSPSAS